MRSNSEIVPEVRILSLPNEARQAMNRLRVELRDLGEGATDEQIYALINEELEKLSDVNHDKDKRRLFISELFSI